MTEAVPEPPKADPPKGPWRIFIETEGRVWTLNYASEEMYQAAQATLAQHYDPRVTIKVSDDHGMAQFRWEEIKFVRCADYAGMLRGDLAYSTLDLEAHRDRQAVVAKTLLGGAPVQFILADEAPIPGEFN